MAVSHIGTEEILESAKRIKRSLKQKYSSNPFMDSDFKMNLPTCKNMNINSIITYVGRPCQVGKGHKWCLHSGERVLM